LLASAAIAATVLEKRRHVDGHGDGPPPGPRRERLVGDAVRDAERIERDAERPVAEAKQMAKRLDRAQERRPRLAFPLAVVKKFGDDKASDLAALVAYYAFFSIFPLMLAVVTVLGFVLDGRPDLQKDLVDGALGQIPVIGQQLDPANGTLEGSGIGLAIGLAGAIFAGLGAMAAAQTAMNRIWYVPVGELPKGLEKRGRAVVALGVIGLGTIGTTIIANLASLLPDLGIVSRIAILAGALVVNVGVFAVAFKVLTSRHLSVRELIPGAVLASVAWFLLQLAGAWYFNTRVKGASDTYGTFALVIGLLSWFYLLAQITILCAEINVVRAFRLWPRSFVPGDGTDADRAVVALRVRAQLPDGWTPDELAATLRSPVGSVPSTPAP
jgi:YihY family inner membrane protein